MRLPVAVWVCLLGLIVGVVGDLIPLEPGAVVDPQPAATSCSEQLNGSQTQLGAFIPQCDDAGQYEPLQCHGSTGYCWCVNAAGESITEQFRASDEEARTAEECVELRQENLQSTTSAAAEDRAENEHDDENDEKLGLIFVLAFVSLVLLPVALAFVLRRVCANPDEAGSRTSLVDASDNVELEDGSDEEDRERASNGATKSEKTPLSRSSGS